MAEDIKVHVVKYPDRDNLVMRYLDPLSGRQVHRSTRTTIKREAERTAAKWEAELQEGRYKALCRLTWEEFRERCELEVATGLAEGTVENKSTAFNHLERLIAPQRVADLTTARMSAFVGKLRADGMGETTLPATLAHLKPVLRWAVRQGYLRAMPEIDIPHRAKGVSQTMRGRPLTGEELERMIAKVPTKRKREPEK